MRIVRWSIWIAIAVAGCSRSTPRGELQPTRTVTIDLAPDRPAKADLLFVVDDSAAMAHAESPLAALADELVNLALGDSIDWRVAVTTADLGAGAYTGGNCKPGGDGARLRQPPDCGVPLGLLDPRTPNASPALACLLAAGGLGCDFQSPLEAAWLALHQPAAEDLPFLRPDAQLAVIFVSARDDCSAPSGSPIYDPNSSLGAMTPFRCATQSLACGNPPAPLPPTPGGAFTDCAPVDTPALFSLAKYIDLFTLPAAQGGLKDDPSQVVVAAIIGPSSLIEVDTINSQPALAPSCENPDGQFGEPALRMQQVVQAATGSPPSGDQICDPAFNLTVQQVELALRARAVTGCVPFAVEDPATLDCNVTLTIDNPGSPMFQAQLGLCSQSQPPCWGLQITDACAGFSPDRMQLFVNASQAPPGTTFQATCAVP